MFIYTLNDNKNFTSLSYMLYLYQIEIEVGKIAIYNYSLFADYTSLFSGEEDQALANRHPMVDLRTRRVP
jgi:hypothetical protein